MDEDKEIFKIKSVNGNFVVKEDKRKTISPFNSAKHFKDANIPALCDQCIYRSIEEGGNGKCPKYEKGAVCAIREDFVKLLNSMDTRQPEDVKDMLDLIAKLSMENVLMALTQAKFDGNVPDRNTKSEINTLLNVIKAINDLNGKIVLTEKTEFGKTGDISSIFRQIKAQKSVSDNAKNDERTD
jgi:hypothetical protein